MYESTYIDNIIETCINDLESIRIDDEIINKKHMIKHVIYTLSQV